MAASGRYFAVCCIDDSAAQIVNGFLAVAYSAKDDSFSTPFIGKDDSECFKLIREMTVRNKSDLNYEYLVILDERSSKGSTALVANSFDPNNELQSLRAVFEIVNAMLLSMVAKGSMRDYKEIADGKPDGVLRF